MLGECVSHDFPIFWVKYFGGMRRLSLCVVAAWLGHAEADQGVPADVDLFGQAGSCRQTNGAIRVGERILSEEEWLDDDELDDELANSEFDISTEGVGGDLVEDPPELNPYRPDIPPPKRSPLPPALERSPLDKLVTEPAHPDNMPRHSSPQFITPGISVINYPVSSPLIPP